MNQKEMVKLEEELAQYNGPDRIVSFGEMQKGVEEKEAPVWSIQSDIPTLDNLIEGFEAGELIVVSGRPKSGKSLLLITLTRNFQNQKKPTCWFSYEMPPRQFLAKFPELPALGCMPRRLELSNIWWLEKRVLEAKLKYGVQVFMIDHLHYLVDMSRMKNTSLEIGTVLRKLKMMAIKYDVIIFLVCHIGKIEAGREPEGEDVRDSSFILTEPDSVLMIWRVKDNESQKIKNEAVLKVVMTRRTGCFNKTVSLKKVGGWLVERTYLENPMGKG